MSGIVRLCLSFFPRIAFFLARSLSNLLSYFLFFCSTSLVLLPQISLLLTALLHPPRCKALRVPQSKKKKNDCRFFVAFFTSRFSRCKQVFLCATRLNFVCHFFFTFPFLLVSFRFPPPFLLQFPVFFTFFSQVRFSLFGAAKLLFWMEIDCLQGQRRLEHGRGQQDRWKNWKRREKRGKIQVSPLLARARVRRNNLRVDSAPFLRISVVN